MQNYLMDWSRSENPSLKKGQQSGVCQKHLRVEYTGLLNYILEQSGLTRTMDIRLKLGDVAT